MSSGEKSKMRRAIFRNHEITQSRAKATVEQAKKVEEGLKEKVDHFKEIKNEYESQMNQINDGFVTHLKEIEEQERKKQRMIPQKKLLCTEARALRRRKMKQMETLKMFSSNYDYQYQGMNHNKKFNSIVKPHRALFSTYEPLSNYEARYNATTRIIQEEELEKAKQSSPQKAQNHVY